MNEVFYNQLTTMLPKENIFEQEPLARHTTFRVGGPASIFLEIDHVKQLQEVLLFLDKVGREYYVVGNGSNLLVSDQGYSGVILHISKGMSEVTVHGDRIVAGGGALLATVAKVAADHQLTGMEFASGIPGSIGGGVVMNAGAYDGQMEDIVKKVCVVSLAGQYMELQKQAMEFDYRSSVIRKYKHIVTSVELQLSPGNPEEISRKMEDLTMRRKEKQPLEYPSAGSTFKRPEGNYAGKLIMEAGLAGYSVGGARVSTKHCGFVINEGNASAMDVYRLISDVQEKVYAHSGIMLEPEVVMLGSFS